MATSPATSPRLPADGRVGAERSTVRRSTETKAAFKTTELIAYLAATAGVLTPAVAFGTVLIERLQRIGVTFEELTGTPSAS